MSPALSLWAASVSVGLVYEALNGVFPVWRWQVSGGLGPWAAEALIVILGYVVLFHPMLILARLVMGEAPARTGSLQRTE